MPLMYYLQTHIFSITVLLLIFFYVYQKREQRDTEQTLYIVMLITNIAILTVDLALWVLDGRDGVRPILLILGVLYCTLNPLMCLLWSLYADYQVYRSEFRLWRKLSLFITPVLVNAFLAVLSGFGDVLFFIDANNMYRRGPFSMVMNFVGYFYMAYALLLIVINRRRISKRLFHALLLFSFPPLLGGIIQVLNFGYSLIWTSSALSMLIAFIRIQNLQLRTDYLTGLANRRQLDRYMNSLKTRSGEWCKSGIMIDINSFKKINDQYGHAAGDQALEYTAGLLRKTFGKSDFIARYGGDEFVVLSDVTNPQALDTLVASLRENIADFNQKNLVPYTLEISVGYDVIGSESETTMHDFLLHIDRLMYINKQKIKS